LRTSPSLFKERKAWFTVLLQKNMLQKSKIEKTVFFNGKPMVK
jgi:hypothetical protein